MARAKKSKSTTTLPFWKRITPDGWVGIALGVVAIFVGGYFAYPSFVADSYEVEAFETKKKSSAGSSSYPGCGFPPYFVRDTLYVLITCFEDPEDANAGNPYGIGIERRIDILSDSLNLPIVFCYRKDLSPNQRRDADLLREKFRADLVIWGKLKNASSECNVYGFCLQFEISDSLIKYAVGKVSKPKLDDYQFGISGDNFETVLIRMGSELFDQWLVDMSDLKVKKQKPNVYAVEEGLDSKKKAKAYSTNADIQYSLGRFTEAIAELDKAIAIDSQNSTFYAHRGVAKCKLDRYSEAIADFGKSISINPRDGGSYSNRGAAKWKSGYKDEAIADLDHAIIINSKNADAYYNRGFVKGNSGHHAEAIADFDTAIALNPNYTLAYNERGFYKGLYIGPTEAIADFDKAIAINPKDLLAYQYKAFAKYKLGNYAEAISNYDKVIAIDSQNVIAYANRGTLKGKLNRHTEAIADFDKAIDIDPKFALAYYNRASAKREKWQIWGCISDYLHGFWLDPSKAWELYLLIMALIYFWKFKTINHNLRRLFTFLSQALKKALRRA